MSQIKNQDLLEFAAEIASDDGWDFVTVANVAKRAGKSRQWVHRLYPGAEPLQFALMGYLFDDWYQKNLLVMAQRKPLSQSIELSFDILINESPHMLVSIRKLFGETKTCVQGLYSQAREIVENLWMPLWQQECGLTKEQGVAATAVVFWGSIALAGLVQNRDLTREQAIASLNAIAKGLVSDAAG